MRTIDGREDDFAIELDEQSQLNRRLKVANIMTSNAFKLVSGDKAFERTCFRLSSWLSQLRYYLVLLQVDGLASRKDYGGIRMIRSWFTMATEPGLPPFWSMINDQRWMIIHHPSLIIHR
jgi:hypothetical protein